MRGPPGAGTAAALGLVALTACHPAPSGFTLLFLGRSPAARVGTLSWAPDPDHSRLVGFDGTLHVVRTIADPRLATPIAVAALHGRLLVTERTGEGVVFDTSGRPVREWPSPFPASLNATGDDRIIAARSPYLVQFVGEDGSQPLLWLLDTLGRPSHGLGVTHVPEVAYLAQLANAGAVALAPDGSIYFAPLVRDEILKLDATGATVWRTQRGLFREEPDPHFLPSKGREIGVAYAMVNIAMSVGPDGRLYALGAEDSAATRLRLDVLDPTSGRIVTTRTLGTRASGAICSSPPSPCPTSQASRCGSTIIAARSRSSISGHRGAGRAAKSSRTWRSCTRASHATKSTSRRFPTTWTQARCARSSPSSGRRSQFWWAAAA